MSLDQGIGMAQQITARAGVGAVLMWAVLATAPLSYAQTIENNDVTTGDKSPVNLGGEQNITYNEAYSLERFVNDLTLIRDHYASQLANTTDPATQQLLQAQIDNIDQQLANPELAFAIARTGLNAARDAVPQVAKGMSADLIAAAQNALDKGNQEAATALYIQLLDDKSGDVDQSAEAAFQLGKFAELNVDWRTASDRYAEAANRAPTPERLRKAQEFAWRLGDYLEALVLGRKMLKLVLKDPGPNTEEHVAALNNLALMYKAAGQYEQAEPLYREAIDIDQLFLDADSMAHAARLMNFANMLGKMKRYDEAEANMREAVEISEKHLDPDHHVRAIVLNNHALLLAQMGRPEDAVPLYREAIRIDLANPQIGDRHPQYAVHLANIAVALRDLGEYEEAGDAFIEAMKIDRATIGEQHPTHAMTLGEYAILKTRTGKTGAARKLWDKMFEIYKASVGTGHPDTREGAGRYAAFLRKHFPEDPALGRLERLFGPEIGK